MTRARYAVGIDLGTTHTVVAYALSERPNDISILPIPQVVHAGEIAARPELPSILVFPPEGEPVHDWADTSSPWIGGAYARRRAPELPGRVVASAKSWFSHPVVDPLAAHLPAPAADGVSRISAVEASVRYLRHVARAFTEHTGEPLEEQTIALTIPASFDAVARELTVECARRAGLSVTLLEEPQAAFYDLWEGDAPTRLADLAGASDPGGAHLLVADVGGGTTDFSILRVRRSSGELDVERIAVGAHLLLGGDNMDLALLHLALAQTGQAAKKMKASASSWLASTREAKERLLGDAPPETVRLALQSRSSKLVGSTITSTLERAAVVRTIEDGFFPVIEPGEQLVRTRSAIVSTGLPYERDPAVTRHAVAFARSALEPGVRLSGMLLNGGVFASAHLRDRFVERVSHALEADICAIEGVNVHQAVARGATRYAAWRMVQRRGIRSGAARGYYIGVDTPEGRAAVCVVPRGTPESTPRRLELDGLRLRVGKKARFDVYEEDGRPVDRAGTVVSGDDPSLFRLSSAVATIGDAGGDEHSTRAVAIVAELSPVGTIDLSCVHADDGTPLDAALSLDLGDRGGSAVSSRSAPPPATAAPSNSAHSTELAKALAAIETVFGKAQTSVALAPKELGKELERTLGERKRWDVRVARTLADRLIAHRGARRRSPEHERVFWQWLGFCARPGLGFVGDEERVKVIARLVPDKLSFPKEARNWQALFIALRRVSAGMQEPEQIALRDVFDPFVAPSHIKGKRPKIMPESRFDVIELLASLERVPPARRIALGDWLFDAVLGSDDPNLWRRLGRIGAREPAYAAARYVIPPDAITPWIEQTLRRDWQKHSALPEVALALGKKTGSADRDIDDALRARLTARFEKEGVLVDRARELNAIMTTDSSTRLAGVADDLPAGLTLA